MNAIYLPALTSDAMRATQARLASHVMRTPVVPLSGPQIDKLLPKGAQLFAKLELFQRTGTFKARGALNVAMHLTQEQLAKGITAVSAGNHAIAAAFAAAEVGTSARIVVQASANPARLAAARSYGADLVIEPDGPSAFARVERIVAEEGRVFIHPFEGIFTALGTSTVGLELAEQVPKLDAVVVAVGGGGLAGGLAAGIKSLNPRCKVIGVEPEGSDVMHQSFAAGEPVQIKRNNTIADSLAPPMTLPIAYGLCQRYLDKLVRVSDDEICRALALLFADGKLGVEPAGATALAAVLGPLRDELAEHRVGVVVCGANIDCATFCAFLERGRALLP